MVRLISNRGIPIVVTTLFCWFLLQSGESKALPASDLAKTVDNRPLMMNLPPLSRGMGRELDLPVHQNSTAGFSWLWLGVIPLAGSLAWALTWGKRKKSIRLKRVNFQWRCSDLLAAEPGSVKGMIIYRRDESTSIQVESRQLIIECLELQVDEHFRELLKDRDSRAGGDSRNNDSHHFGTQRYGAPIDGEQGHRVHEEQEETHDNSSSGVQRHQEIEKRLMGRVGELLQNFGVEIVDWSFVICGKETGTLHSTSTRTKNRMSQQRGSATKLIRKESASYKKLFPELVQ